MISKEHELGAGVSQLLVDSSAALQHKGPWFESQLNREIFYVEFAFSLQVSYVFLWFQKQHCRLETLNCQVGWINYSFSLSRL